MPDGKKILIAEDDQFLSFILKSRLEREGFTVLQSFDGAQTLEVLKKEIPDLIILDLIMPNVSGFEVLEKVKVDPQLSRIPVVIVSNLGQESDIQKAKNLGAVDYFVKVKTPVDTLVAILKERMQQAETAKQS